MISILGRSMVLIALAVSVLGAFAGIAGGMKRRNRHGSGLGALCTRFCDDGSDLMEYAHYRLFSFVCCHGFTRHPYGLLLYRYGHPWKGRF